MRIRCQKCGRLEGHACDLFCLRCRKALAERTLPLGFAALEDDDAREVFFDTLEEAQWWDKRVPVAFAEWFWTAIPECPTGLRDARWEPPILARVVVAALLCGGWSEKPWPLIAAHQIGPKEYQARFRRTIAPLEQVQVWVDGEAVFAQVREVEIRPYGNLLEFRAEGLVPEQWSHDNPTTAQEVILEHGGLPVVLRHCSLLWSSGYRDGETVRLVIGQGRPFDVELERGKVYGFV